MLHNTAYIGALRYKGHDETVTIPCPALIDRPPWDAAQAQLAVTRQAFAGHRRPTGELIGRPTGQATTPHLLGNGLLRCGTCGATLKVLKRRGRPVYYACTTRLNGGLHLCQQVHHVRYDEITDAILDRFSARHEDVQHDLFAKGWREHEQARLAAYAGYAPTWPGYSAS